jgi:AcrR family transcriptional regulator
MTKRRRPQISARKAPQQARSTALVDAALKAAVQVLAKQGAQRFTMARVAAKAGVSIGSLYQYFPNKAAILFRLQSDEWRQTSNLLRDILEDASRPPLERLRILVHACLVSECEEASLRLALGDAAPLYRDAPESRAARATGEQAVARFLREALPDLSNAERALSGELMTATLSAIGKQFSELPRTPAEIEAYAAALADMLCGYVAGLQAGTRGGVKSRRVRGGVGRDPLARPKKP